jgi:hypothetical protein
MNDTAIALLSPVVELRQYELRPGNRDALIELFDRHLIEGQEECGMTIIGQYRNVDDPDRFVWLRGFDDMASRGDALTGFYVTGPVWAAHRDAARATMVDTDNALLLRPVSPDSAFRAPATRRPGLDEATPATSRIVATLYHRDAPVDDAFRAFWTERVLPLVTEHGADVLAWFETDPSENTFPALPVREGEHIFVWFARFGSASMHDAFEVALARSAEWTEAVLPALTGQLVRAPERLRLEPTLRSWVR